MSAAVAAATKTTPATGSPCNSLTSASNINNVQQQAPPPPSLSRYESQKRRDWNTFGQYLKNHRPPLNLSRCSGAHVVEFLRYLDQFGKTKVHNYSCPSSATYTLRLRVHAPLRQAWGSLDALIGRLRAAFEENGGHPETNPFGARAVQLYLKEVRDSQAKARGIAYEKKKRKKTQHIVLGQSQSQSSLAVDVHHVNLLVGSKDVGQAQNDQSSWACTQLSPMKL